MKRFEFRLQALLTLALQKEQRALEEYGRALAAELVEKDHLARIEREINSTDEMIRRLENSRFAPDEIVRLLIWKDSLREQHIKQLEVLRQVQLVLFEKWDQLMKIRLVKQVLEKLKAKAFAKFRYHQQLLEQKQLDELAAIRYSRQLGRQQ